MEFKNIANGSKFTSIQIGGSFSILLDTKEKALVWGANTNGEMGLGDTQPRIQPTYIDSIHEK